MCDFNEIYTEKIEDTPTVLTELYKLNKKVDEYIENHGYGTIIKDDGTPIPSVELNNSPAPNSNSLVKSGGIYSALEGKQDNLTFDNTPTENSNNPVKSGGVYSALAGKQDTLTFDNTPTEDSNNPVKSGGVYSALATKQDTLTFDNVPTEDSDNPVKSGGVYSALTETKQYIDNNFSNPNLLINGDFRVNQRGQTTYTSTGSGTNQRIYGCDRLNIFNGASVEIQTNSGIKAILPTRYAGIRYRMEENDYSKLLGKTVTFTIKISNSTLNRNNREMQIYGESAIISKQITGNGIYTLTATIPSSLSQLDFRVITYSTDANTDTLYIDWWKVEVGEVSTTFAARPYAEELALCQRYYWNNLPDASLTYAILGVGFCASTTRIDAIINLPCNMRVDPVIKFNGQSTFPSTTYYPNVNGDGNPITNMEIGKRCANTITVKCTTSGLTMDSIGIVRTKDTICYLEFDAEIY